jgi:hypothetical protein
MVIYRIFFSSLSSPGTGGLQLKMGMELVGPTTMTSRWGGTLSKSGRCGSSGTGKSGMSGTTIRRSRYVSPCDSSPVLCELEKPAADVGSGGKKIQREGPGV